MRCADGGAAAIERMNALRTSGRTMEVCQSHMPG